MSKISVFSKFDMAGGSEFRCVELANGIARFSEHESFILAEKEIPKKLLNGITPFNYSCTSLSSSSISFARCSVSFL